MALRFAMRLLARFARPPAVALVALAAGVSLPLEGNAASIVRTGEAPSLCGSESPRATIPQSFRLAACFDGTHARVRNNQEFVVVLHPSGSVGSPHVIQSRDPASGVTHRRFPSTWLLAPGDEVVVSVGSASGAISIAGTAGTAFYKVARVVVERLRGDAALAAIPSFVQGIVTDTSQYRKCVSEQHGSKSASCRSSFIHSITAAIDQRVSSSAKRAKAVSALTAPAAITKLASALSSGLSAVVDGARSITFAASGGSLVPYSNLAVCPGTDAHRSRGNQTTCNQNWAATSFLPGQQLVCSVTTNGGAGHTFGMNWLVNGQTIRSFSGGGLGSQRPYSETYNAPGGGYSMPAGAYACQLTVDGKVAAQLPFTVQAAGSLGSSTASGPSRQTGGSGVASASICPDSDWVANTDVAGSGSCVRTSNGQVLSGNPGAIHCAVRIANTSQPFALALFVTSAGQTVGFSDTQWGNDYWLYGLIGPANGPWPPGTYTCQIALASAWPNNGQPPVQLTSPLRQVSVTIAPYAAP